MTLFFIKRKHCYLVFVQGDMKWIFNVQFIGETIYTFRIKLYAIMKPPTYLERTHFSNGYTIPWTCETKALLLFCRGGKGKMILEISSHLQMLWLYGATLLAAKRWPLAQTHLCSSSKATKATCNTYAQLRALFLPTSLPLGRATGAKTVIPARETEEGWAWDYRDMNQSLDLLGLRGDHFRPQRDAKYCDFHLMWSNDWGKSR